MSAVAAACCPFVAAVQSAFERPTLHFVASLLNRFWERCIQSGPILLDYPAGRGLSFNIVYYAHSGNQMLALNSASGEARIATPRIPLPLNQVGVTMWYVDLALSLSGLMRVVFYN